ncbi:MAG: WS/DGAT/MGAT family O-acyltransferase [Parahaliea sp.]
MRQISGGDALFLYTDRQSRHQHIATLLIYDPSTAKEQPLRFKTILQTIEERLGTSPIFRQKLVSVPFNLDYPYWVNDPDFDLEYHVRHIALPKPGDWRQFCIQVSRLHSLSLDMSRPLWETYVIEGLDNIDFLPKGAFAIMTKVHHVAIDGVSAAEMILGLHDFEPNPTEPRRQQRWRPGQVPGAATMLSKAGVNNLRNTLRSSKALIKGLGSSLTTSNEDEETNNTAQPAGPPTRFNDPISPHRVWDAIRFPMDEIKAIRTVAPGATINDVVLTICGGAMTRYLDDKKERPDQDLTAMVPVSVRADTERNQGGNKVHLTRARLCTTEDDPVKRLEKVRDTMTTVKALNVNNARQMVEVQEQLPAPTLLIVGRAVAAARGPGKNYRKTHNMVVTNVPGPAQPLYFCGARVLMLTGLAVISDNLGMSHTITSYDGTLTIAPLSDRAMVPDPDFYAKCVREAYNELKKAAISKLKTGSKSPSGKKAGSGASKPAAATKTAAKAKAKAAAPRKATPKSQARSDAK